MQASSSRQLKDFNSHAHVERDRRTKKHFKTIQHFNSHAHVERDNPHIFRSIITTKISTHTLTWSVTLTASMR